MKQFRSFEEACRASKQRKAVGNIRVEMQDGRVIDADIVKPLQGNGEISWEGTAYPIRRATTREVDTVRWWRPYV